MKRHILTLALGASMLGIAALAACGGGGSSTPNGLVSAPANTGGNTVSTTSGAHIVFTVVRSATKKAASTKKRSAAGARNVAATRKPAYISTSALGMQIAVSASGSTKTIYADISTTSPLCTTVPFRFGGVSTATCTVAIPTLATSETIVATEVDQAPIGDTNGYGTGFGTGSNILAVGTTTTAITGTANTITLGIGPVAAIWYDCTGNFETSGPPGTNASAYPTAGPNFGADSPGGGSPARIVVTGAIAVSGVLYPEFEDVDQGWYDVSSSPVPLVDVNGSPAPNTITASNAGITFAPALNNATPPPAGAFTATASIPSDAYEWDECVFAIPFNVAASTPGTSATITLSNNLTALNPFLIPPASYANTFVYPVAFVTASAVTGSPAVTGSVTGTVTGTDFQATNGMGAESAYMANDGNCNSGVTTLATISTAGSIDTTTWQQMFTISPVAPGTCTFVLYDNDTSVITKTVTVTIGS